MGGCLPGPYPPKVEDVRAIVTSAERTPREHADTQHERRNERDRCDGIDWASILDQAHPSTPAVRIDRGA